MFFGRGGKKYDWEAYRVLVKVLVLIIYTRRVVKELYTLLISGVELNSELCAIAEKTVKKHCLNKRVEVKNEDILNVPNLVKVIDIPSPTILSFYIHRFFLFFIFIDIFFVYFFNCLGEISF